MVDGILQSSPTDEKGKLKVILSSWTEHNKEYSQKFRKWVERANNLEDDPIYNGALQAAKEGEKANERLSQALVELEAGG